VEIRTDKDPDNLHLRKKEENDLMAYVASIVLKRPSPDGWVPAADVHAQVCYAKLFIFCRFSNSKNKFNHLD
jgi:hypothetical protein